MRKVDNRALFQTKILKLIHYLHKRVHIKKNIYICIYIYKRISSWFPQTSCCGDEGSKHCVFQQLSQTSFVRGFFHDQMWGDS